MPGPAPVAMSARTPTRTHTHVGPCQGERYAALEREAKKVCVCASGVRMCVCVHNAEEAPGERAHEQRKGANSIMQIAAH